MDDPVNISALITAVVALTISVFSNGFLLLRERYTHDLSKKRELEKYYFEAYKELFAPAIADVFLYIDGATQYMEGPSVEFLVEAKDRAIAHIEQHLTYASPSLISALHNIRSAAVVDQYGANPSKTEIYFLHEFTSEYAEVIKRASIFSEVDKQQMPPIAKRLILYLLHYHDFTELASYSWKFDRLAYKEKNYLKIKKLVEEYNSSYSHIYGETQRKTHLRLEALHTEKISASLDEINAADALAREDWKIAEIAIKQKKTTLFNQILGIMIKNKELRREVANWLS